MALDRAWLWALLADYTVLVRSLGGAARSFLHYWAHRCELGNLKAIVRGKLAGQAADHIRTALVDIGPFATLKLEPLLTADDMPELLRRLEHTPYAELARPARRIFEQRGDAFLLDATLDWRFYEGLLRRLQALRGEDRRWLDFLAEALLDQVNLSWLLRYRFNYQLPPAEAYYLLIPTPFGLSPEVLRKLAQQPDLATTLAALPAPLALLLAGVDSLYAVQQRLNAEVVRRARWVLRHTHFNLGRAWAYLWLREQELRRLAMILKGHIWGLPSDWVRLATDLPV
jgi:V/A-type H+-transporting ATPase subunit C